MRGINILEDWKFYLGEPEAAHRSETDDSHWRSVNIPHDWSVELPFDGEKGQACTGFLLGGIGWYRKHFETKERMLGCEVILSFDGIYNRASIYCNGTLVKFHPYGYSPTKVDVTAYLNPLGTDNVIAVRVDHSRYADSRWYTGSGIYRKVSMYILPKVHIPVWGVKIATESVVEGVANVYGVVLVKGLARADQNIVLAIKAIDEQGETVFNQHHNVTIVKGESTEIHFKAIIKSPILWDVFKGNQYQLITELIEDNICVQKVKEKFGVRTFRFDVDQGFFINGKSMLIKGVCLHHDGGLVGAAVPTDVWKRRLESLKACGCNAIRTAHNPASEEFLDLCDEMGFLVQEEFFDEWDNPKDKRKNNQEVTVDYITRAYTEHFRDYAQRDLQDTVRRDINHPCIIQWSIGNEIEWTYPKYNVATGFYDEDAIGYRYWLKPPYTKDEIRQRVHNIPRDFYDVDKTAQNLARWTKEMDTTRPVIANCILPTVSYENGLIDALDMVGYSYRKVIYDYGHKHYPDKPIMGTENRPQWHEWKVVLEKEFIPGVFLWTGIDHIGEAWVQKPWPRKGSNLGLLDLAGFEKPPYHMFKSLWQDQPHIKMYTQRLEASLYEVNDKGVLFDPVENGWERRNWFWQEVNDYWQYEAEAQIVVELYSNCDTIELFLNEVSLGEKNLAEFDDRIYKWLVPYTQGELVAKGQKDGGIVMDRLITAGQIDGVIIDLDKKILENDPDSVGHIVLELIDKAGNAIRYEEAEIRLECSGNGHLLGVDNGDPDNVQAFQGNVIRTSQGRCLAIVQATGIGEIRVKAFIDELGIESEIILIKVK